MASTTTDITAPRQGFWARFCDWAERRFEQSPRVQARRAQIAALEAKSDAELARLGLRREDIPYHVFKDLFYI
ncbi:MAG: hypothetical protein H5U16_05345 [Roseovarius sp.]|nr:hypothetical protein [Roseovarius sp.]